MNDSSIVSIFSRWEAEPLSRRCGVTEDGAVTKDV
jgi:hypothetical protein